MELWRVLLGELEGSHRPLGTRSCPRAKKEAKVSKLAPTFRSIFGAQVGVMLANFADKNGNNFSINFGTLLA